ncbi:Uma2 family endonuclease [Leptodesmis sp.]|uniref:Uma2 family endonuclease n=1 Tax=Leptodesmis sp. TaxID=3100501 RepID=UPI00405355D4
MTAFTIDLTPVIRLTDDQFYQLCQANPEIKFERSAQGELIIMAPTGGETGNCNIEIAADFVIWNRQTQLGKVFDSSTGFRLPNGAARSPDVAWVRQERWDALTPAERKAFPPLCPDFVLELRSPGDSLSKLQAKMREYIENGAQLGWLLNRQDQQVEIYRPGQAVEVLETPAFLSGESVLPGFILHLHWFW